MTMIRKMEDNVKMGLSFKKVKSLEIENKIFIILLSYTQHTYGKHNNKVLCSTSQSVSSSLVKK